MSTLSQAMVKALQRGRDVAGEWVLFHGKPYRCRTVEVAGAKAGEQAVSHLVYGVFLASVAPRLFEFNAMDFQPNTSVTPPIEGDELVRNGLIYVCTSVDYVNIDDDTVAIQCYCLRKIWQVPPAPTGF